MASESTMDGGSLESQNSFDPPSQDGSVKRSADFLFVPETTDHKRQKHDDNDVHSFTQENGSTPTSTEGMISQIEEHTDSFTSTQHTMNTTPSPAPTATMYSATKEPTPPPGPKVVNGRTLPYDAFATEGRPRLAVFHQSFTKAENAVTSVCRGFIAAFEELQKDGYANEEVHSMVYKRLQNLRAPQANYPNVLPIAFLGPAGVGKSSGIVSYLSQLGVAIQSDSGGRGTSVVHEYRDARPGQLQKFLVVVRYFSRKTIARTIEGHCQAIFKYMEIDSKSELEEEEIVMMRERSTTAITFFVTLLCGEDDFETSDDAAEYFKERKSEDKEETTEHLITLVQSLLQNRGVIDNDYEEMYPADNTAQLNEVFRKVSGSAGQVVNGKSSLWPLVHRIQVHLDNDLLKTGVVLADLPGVSDSDGTVTSSTQSYLGDAGTILVFTDPGRCKQNSILDANLAGCLRLQKQEQVYVVVTRIDNKDAYTDAERKELLPEDAEELDVAEQKVLKSQQELCQAVREKDAATDYEGLKRADKRMQEAEFALKAAEAMVKQVTITIRNRDIARCLKGKFRELSGRKNECDLRVLFTSNAVYQKYLAGFDLKDTPTLDIKSTGVPSVREMLYKTAAQGQHHTLSKIIRLRLPSIFNSIKEVLTRSRLERKQDVEQIIQKVLEHDEYIVQATAMELDTAFKQKVLKTFTDNNAKWQDAADAKLTCWSHLAAGSFGAFCRRAGEFKPKNGTKANWTCEIQSILKARLNAAFNDFEQTTEAIEKQTLLEVDGLYRKLEERLEGHEAFQAVNEKDFVRAIRTIRDNASRDMAARFDVFRRYVEFLRSKTTLDKVDGDSYTTVAMREAFEAVAAAILPSVSSNAPPIHLPSRNGKMKKRGGVHAIRVHELRKKFTGTGGAIGIFITISKALSKDFDTRLREWADGTETKLCRASQAVLQDFNTKFSTDAPEIKDEVDENHVQAIICECDKAIDILQGEVENLLLECEEYENCSA